MKLITHYYKRLRIPKIKVALLVAAINLFFIPAYTPYVVVSDYIYEVSLNGVNVGTIADYEEAGLMLREARRAIAAVSEELVLVEGEIAYSKVEVFPGDDLLDEPEAVLTKMKDVLKNNIRETMHRSYTVKINDFMVNLASKEEVTALLQAAIDKYDEEQRFAVTLSLDGGRELSVLTAEVFMRELLFADEELEVMNIEAGIDYVLTDIFASATPAIEKDFADYDNGLISIDFGDTVEVVEAYLLPEELIDLDLAIEEITKEEEKNKIYEVVSGDTLSGISLKTNIPMDRIIELNDSLEHEGTTIRIGDELIITVPEPEIVIVRKEERFIEEYYNEETIYIPIDDWYTTQTRTIQEPSAGIRNIAAITSYHNDNIVDREILKEEILYQAVPKIVERGTKIPPTYIKPLSGGRLSSGFGSRSAPTRGASTYHRGIDWATPVGTPIVASSGGVVAKAGWGSGYGYVVYINHPDGRQTRYGHLSRVLVTAGQNVSQGQRIALSGNTGISSGPHVHFEILINGVQVNPLRYLN
ncbi:MAG: M23 family metallopeptidase [Lachnospiraceae bacterium]|nr:M23 family metallopeptidase [Lachnospiraceae bacterium]